MKLSAVIVLGFIAINLFAQPNDSSAQHKNNSVNQASNPVAPENNYKTEAHADAPKTGSPCWYTSSEWWLVIIAGLTGLAIFYQAREMTRATDVMQGQMIEMQKARELENKTLILQYRPKIVIRNAKALNFSFALGEPGECEM